jgi:long-chain acyl-CoA synthetase
MILSGGENIYSSEVENALASHPAVHAIVVPHAGQSSTLDDLRAHFQRIRDTLIVSVG